MTKSDTFPTIILTGRPAAGKSEIIDFLKTMCANLRCARFHIAGVAEIDDFVWVWETFQEDDQRSRQGMARLHTTPNYFFLDPSIWNSFVEKINLEFRQRVTREPKYLSDHTVFIEFARGGEKGIGEALSHLSDEILAPAVLLYVRVSYVESLRRNRARMREGEEGSILYHSLPDEKMDFYYKTNDWEQLSHGERDGILQIKGHRIPFAVFENEPEKTSDPTKLGEELERAMNRLWNIRKTALTEENEYA